MTLLMIGAPEIIFITLIVLLLFGGKKIPELMKGLGKGMKSFQDGMKGVDDNPQAEQQPSQTQPNNAGEDDRAPRETADEPPASQVTDASQANSNSETV